MKRKNLKLQTPFANALWPTLVEPRVYTPKGATADPDDKGRYSVTLLFDPDKPDHAEFIEKLESIEQELRDDIKSENPRAKFRDPFIPMEPEFDKENNETGLIAVRFARNAGGISKKTGKEWSAQVPLYDRKGQKYIHDAEQGDIGNGTRMRVEFEINPYVMGGTNGVSFRLSSAQFGLIEYYGGGGSSFAGEEVDPEQFEGDAAPVNAGGEEF